MHIKLSIKHLFFFLGDVIHFSQALPGTRYDFWLYYSNSTLENNSTHNPLHQASGSGVVPVVRGETFTNGRGVPNFLSSQSQWLLTWTASITTGKYVNFINYRLVFNIFSNLVIISFLCTLFSS